MTQTLNITISDKHQATLKKEADKKKLSVQQYVSEAVDTIMSREQQPKIEVMSDSQFRMCSSMINSQYAKLFQNLAKR